MADATQLVERITESGALQNLSPPVQTALFLGCLVLLPAALVCLTSFTRIIIVMSFVRRAVTSQEIPPNSVLTGLSLFLTLFVMAPTLDRIDKEALTPYLHKELNAQDAFARGATPLREFMLRQTRRQDLALFVHLSAGPAPERPEDASFQCLVPAFVISELKTAFLMGFLISLPFLLVDLVVSSVLTSMGMVMMPPAVISAPFKLLLFVLADGWHLIAQALSSSFA
jgi:flagellar biosynthesis protein FliP